MRAMVQKRFGGPEVLELVEMERPQPLPTEVLVRVVAIGVNPIDSIVRSGAFPLIGQPPFVLGWDVSGLVEEVVPGTSRFKVGDDVFGMPFFPRAASAYAEYIAAPSRMLAWKPKGISHAQAASIPLAGLTALQMLTDVADVQPGQRVLIHGAGGGLGHFAVQIAKSMGAYVIGTASKSKHSFVKGLGADEMIDYESVDFAKAVGDVDVVLESIGGDYADRSIRVLRPGGMLVTAVERTNLQLKARVEAAGRRFGGVAVEPDYKGLERLAQLVELGQLRPHVEHALPLAQAGESHRVLETRPKGKVVLMTV